MKSRGACGGMKINRPFLDPELQFFWEIFCFEVKQLRIKYAKIHQERLC